MSSGDSIHPFFEKLKAVACSVNGDVNDIKRKLQKPKFELPQNNALFKLVHLTDDMENFKNKSRDLFQQLIEDSMKYTRYRQDMDCLIAEMEKTIDQVEESLSIYEYKKWNPEHLLQDDSEQLQSATCNTLPFKEKPLTENRLAEQEKQFSSPKTPVLADYGLTTKIPKPVSSALKSKQGSRMKSVKKVHFESPVGQPDKGRENRAPYSLQRTPLLEDYGLPSRKRNIVIDQGTDLMSVKKELNFRSPLSSISESIAESNETAVLRAADVDDSENFKELISSFPSALKISQPGTISKKQINEKAATPEEPALTPLCHPFKKKGPETPKEPELVPVTLSKSTKMVVLPSTPKAPKLDVKLSSFDEWLQQQKKKCTY